jgi:hypothetical protein
MNDEFFDKDSLKLQLELAVRMAEVARSVSEWHRRMTSEKLNQSGQTVDMAKYPVGTRVALLLQATIQTRSGQERSKSEAHRPLCRTSHSDEAHWHQISTTRNGRSQWEEHHIQKGHRDAIAQEAQDMY